MRGEICSISLFKLLGEKEQYTYGIQPLTNEDGHFILNEMVPEVLVFKEREDIFDFCVKLTEEI